jgi:hypothetical protein
LGKLEWIKQDVAGLKEAAEKKAVESKEAAAKEGEAS